MRRAHARSRSLFHPRSMERRSQDATMWKSVAWSTGRNQLKNNAQTWRSAWKILVILQRASLLSQGRTKSTRFTIRQNPPTLLHLPSLNHLSVSGNQRASTSLPSYWGTSMPMQSPMHSQFQTMSTQPSSSSNGSQICHHWTKSK